MSKAAESCLTCYGAGEMVGDDGPTVCPDCFGEGSSLSKNTKIEWRLREIERTHRAVERETWADILWLIHELRGSRDALVRILARCQDADEADAVARDVKYQANEALGIYDPSEATTTAT